jgi:hypothetical protein
MADEVRDYRGAGSTLGQAIVVARDLRKYRRNFRMQHIICILDEKAPNAPKVDAWKKVLKVNVEDVASLLMFYSIGKD